MAYCFIPLHLCHLFSLFAIFSPLFCLMEFDLIFKSHLLEGFPDILTPSHTTELINLPQSHYLRDSLVAQMVKNHLQCRRLRFDPRVRKIPWRREWQPTPVFLPREVHEQRSLAVYSPWDCKESDMTDCQPLSMPCPVFYC